MNAALHTFRLNPDHEMDVHLSDNNLYKVGIPAQRVLRSLRPQQRKLIGNFCTPFIKSASTNTQLCNLHVCLTVSANMPKKVNTNTPVEDLFCSKNGRTEARLFCSKNDRYSVTAGLLKKWQKQCHGWSSQKMAETDTQTDRHTDFTVIYK